MASKRSFLDGITTLWKGYMSRVTIGVGRSGSKSPFEEIVSTVIFIDRVRGLSKVFKVMT